MQNGRNVKTSFQNFLHYARSFVVGSLCLPLFLSTNSTIGGAASGPIILSSFFSNASVINSKGQKLSSTYSSCTASVWSNGCAYLNPASGTFQNGQPYSANNLWILPPSNSSDFTKVVFNQPSTSGLASGSGWSLTGTYGISNAIGDGSQGVNVKIVVSGQEPGSSTISWATIDSFTVSLNRNTSRTSILGNWPTLNGFQIAIQVSALGANNAWDNLVVDGLTLNPIAGSVQIPSLALSSYFPKTSVVNNSTSIPNTQALCNSKAWANGCAYLTLSSGLYQNGQYFGTNAFLLLPPSDSSNFSKVLFNQPSQLSLAPAFQWNLNGTYGFQKNSGNQNTGVKVQIVVSGTPIDQTDKPWDVVDTFIVSGSNVLWHSTPLGTWPLRKNFNVAVQVSAIGANNYGDNLVIDNLALSPTVPRPSLGVAQSNLVWSSDPLPVVSGIGTMGSSWIRTDMRDSSLATSFANIVVHANNAGMHVIALILTDSEDYDNPTNSAGNNTDAYKQLCGYPGGAMKVSEINVSKFTQRFTTHLQALKAAGANVDAFEIGNELDWVCFNGDIPLGATGITVVSQAPFIQKYALLLKAAKQVMNTYYPTSKLITFGAANCSLFTNTSCIQDPQNLLDGLQNIGGTNYLSLVDGYGEHLYPPPSNVAAALTVLQNTANSLGNSKPFWITEWGLYNTTGQERYLGFRQFLELMNSTGAINVGHLELYTYSTAESWSLLSGGTTGSVVPEARIFEQYNPLLKP